MIIELVTEIIDETIRTAYNKRFSEMAVGVETRSLLHPLTAYGILRCGAPNPPLRQAAGRCATCSQNLRGNLHKRKNQID